MYTVAAVSEHTRDWTAKAGGQMRSYRVHLKDAAGVLTQNVEWAKKITSNPPQVGEQVDGNVDNTPHGLKLKIAYQGSPGGGGGGGGRPKSPEEQAHIAASVALKWACEAVEQAATFGVAGAKPTTVDEHAALLKRYADYGFAFIEKKGKPAA